MPLPSSDTEPVSVLSRSTTASPKSALTAASTITATRATVISPARSRVRRNTAQYAMPSAKEIQAVR